MKTADSISRGQFIQTGGKTAAVVAGAISAPAILRGAESASDSVRVARIGLGTRGDNLIRSAASSRACKVVAVCDVYQPHLKNGFKLSNNPGVKAHADYKELLNDPQVEAVMQLGHRGRQLAAADAAKEEIV